MTTLLLIRHGDSLTLYLNARLRDWHEAEDLMIEAFARIMVKRPGIRDGGFKAYLFKTARNLAARSESKRKRLATFELDTYEEDASEPDRAVSRLLETERKTALHRCLGRIDPVYREALWLVYAEDMSYAQAADVLGTTRKRIDNLLSQGKQLMRRELEKEGVTDAHE